jgi:protocatechuate 3,4-dioxygenase beta subunit
MKRALPLLVVAVLVVAAALLFATCGEREASSPRGSVADGDRAPAKPDPVPRKRTGPTVADEKPADAPAPTAATKWRWATLEVTPPDAKVAAPKHVLRGRVVNPKGEPVAEADVHLFSMWLPPESAEPRDESWATHAESSMTTGPDGKFALTYFEGGPRALLVEWKGERRRQVHGLSDDEEHEIVIDEHPPSLLVHVTRAVDGTAVLEARVALLVPVMPDVHPMKGPGGWTYPDVKSIGPGMWRISQGPEGPALLTVRADGLAPETERRVEMRADREETIEVALKKGVSVRGVVVDAVTGAPIAGAHVERPQAWYFERLETETETDGRFELTDAPLSARSFVRFTARADGYAASSFFVEGDAATETTVRLVRAASIVVRCLGSDGRPAAGARVVVSSDYDATPPKGMRTTDTDTAWATTDAEGRARIEGVRPGSDGMELRARFYVDGVAALDRAFPALAAGETRDLGDVVLAPTLTLRGVVLDADGKPAAGATVGAAPSDPSDPERSAVGSAFNGHGGRSAETGPDGTFTMMGLGAGLWDVYAAPNFYTPGRLELGVDPRVRTVTLRLPRVVALVGRIVDEKGAPVAGALIEAAPDFFGMRTTMQQSTGDDGRFALPGFAADATEFDVSVVATKGASAQKFKVRPGVAGTELRLR